MRNMIMVGILFLVGCGKDPSPVAAQESSAVVMSCAPDTECGVMCRDREANCRTGCGSMRSLSGKQWCEHDCRVATGECVKAACREACSSQSGWSECVQACQDTQYE